MGRLEELMLAICRVCMLLLVGCGILRPQTLTPPLRWSGRIRLSVAAEASLKSQITSYVSRELRALRDVSLVEDDPEYSIEIAAMALSNKANITVGAVLSTVVTGQLSASSLDALKADLVALKADGKTPTAISILSGLKGRQYLLSHYIDSGSTPDLQAMCQELVAKIDTATFQHTRQTYQQLEDLRRRQ